MTQRSARTFRRPPEEYPTSTYRCVQDLTPLDNERKRLAESCYYLAVGLANRFYRLLGDEAFGIARLHLVRCAAKFQGSRGKGFASVATTYITKGLLLAVREKKHTSRGGKVSILETSTLVKNSEYASWEPLDDSQAQRREISERLEELQVLLRPLSEREREILCQRANGALFRDIAATLGISRETVRLIEKRALEKIEREYLRREEPPR